MTLTVINSREQNVSDALKEHTLTKMENAKLKIPTANKFQPQANVLHAILVILLIKMVSVTSTKTSTVMNGVMEDAKNVQ